VPSCFSGNAPYTTNPTTLDYKTGFRGMRGEPGVSAERKKDAVTLKQSRTYGIVNTIATLNFGKDQSKSYKHG
jgi:hypothetical protein